METNAATEEARAVLTCELDMNSTAARDAWMREVHDKHARPVYRYLVRQTLGNREAAEDLLQETLLRAWYRADRLPAEADRVRPWLFTVARNLVIDAGRNKKARPTEIGYEHVTLLPDRGDPVDRMLTSTTVRQALLTLTPKHRTVLVELYFRGASVAETAARIGIPEGTVKSRAHQALRAMRQAIGSREG